MLDFAQAKFPFACQLRARQFRHRAFQEHDRLDGLSRRLKLLPLPGQIMS